MRFSGECSIIMCSAIESSIPKAFVSDAVSALSASGEFLATSCAVAFGAMTNRRETNRSVSKSKRPLFNDRIVRDEKRGDIAKSFL